MDRFFKMKDFWSKNGKVDFLINEGFPHFTVVVMWINP